MRIRVTASDPTVKKIPPATFAAVSAIFAGVRR
jgi:hypothetical protein